jgi:deoxyribodipyrimidine photo-lyase
MDRDSLNTRDANGFTGIAWAIGGRHDRPFAERDILGLIRPMGANGMARALDVPAYIRSIEALTGEAVPPLTPDRQMRLGE